MAIGPKPSDPWSPILMGWYQRVKPHVLELGLLPGSLWIEAAVDKIKVEAIETGQSGYMSLVNGCYVIEYRQDLDPVERERTVAHELAHVICHAGGRGSDHHDLWKRVVTLLGFPEEAEREWSNAVL